MRHLLLFVSRAGSLVLILRVASVVPTYLF